jgi:hypothetical protein
MAYNVFLLAATLFAQPLFSATRSAEFRGAFFAASYIAPDNEYARFCDIAQAVPELSRS